MQQPKEQPKQQPKQHIEQQTESSATQKKKAADELTVENWQLIFETLI